MSNTLVPEPTFEGWQTLWRQRLRVLLANIANGQREYREINLISRHIRADYAGRFLVELLQNASDQAAKAHLKSSTVVIVRTRHSLAITNQGIPFDNEGIEAVTSLGLSPKDPEFAIGNKGVGFKSVFQVSTAPEILSAPSPYQSFTTPRGPRFQLHEQPFETQRGAKLLEQLVDELLISQQESAAEIAARHPGRTVRETVLHEARQAAPFKYPLPIDELDLSQRLKDLSLPEEALGAQTLIVLPLLSQTDTIINAALDELVSIKDRTPVGTILLFLPAITRIDIIDRVRGHFWRLERQTTGAVHHLPRGSHVGTVTTSCSMDPHLDPAGHKREVVHWWIASRTLGDERSSDHLRREQERATLEEATRNLPGEGWNRIRTTTVSVALPYWASNEPHPLGARGRFCIALPTLLDTGSPFWVDARFHGKLDRKSLDFKNLRFNALLLREAVLLASDVIEHFKAAPQLEVRRYATLALERASGEFGDSLYAVDGPAYQKVILSRDQQRYLHASQMSLLPEEDHWLLQQAEAAVGPLETYGLHLPDSGLATYARRILENLPGTKKPISPELYWITRPPTGELTLLERCAQHYRKAGPSFWEPFLKKILGFSYESVKRLALLPVGIDGVAAPASNVFFAPTASVNATFDEDEVEEVPELVRRDLRFFDEQAMRVRERGRAYTPIAKQLADHKLVLSPRREPLLKDALLPALAELSKQPDRSAACLRLLHVAGQWVRGLTDPELRRVGMENFVLPVPAQDGNWKWTSPETIYLGPGWSEEHWDRLLTQAYGHTPQRRLVPWVDFARILVVAGIVEPDLSWWHALAVRIGVKHVPIKWRPQVHPGFMLRRSSRGAWPIINTCPLSGLENFWTPYLKYAILFLNQTKHFGDFTIQDILWIDGLERPESRTAIVEMLLHQSQDGFETTIIKQSPNITIASIPMPWAFVLKYGGWPIIPTDAGPATIDEAWLPDPKEPEERYRFLKRVSAAFRSAKLLNWLGVTTLSGATAATAPTTRLIKALQHLASQISSLKEDDSRHIKLLAMDLWGLLHQRCAQQQGIALTELLRSPVPLLHEEQLLSVDLSNVLLLLIDDDPTRGRYFSKPPGTFILPVSSRVPIDALVFSLQNLLGVNRVRKTSSVFIDTGFNDLALPIPFLEFLATQDPQANLHLTLLLKYGTAEEVHFEDPTFQRDWAIISGAILRRGNFKADFPGDIFVDIQETRAEVLATINLSAEQILHKANALVRSDRRYGWSLYVNAVTSIPRRVEDFYAALRIGDIERHRAERMLLATGKPQPQPLLAYALARWRHNHRATGLDEFQREWASNASTPQSLSQWLGLSTTAEGFLDPQSPSDDNTILTTIRAFGISIANWQEARAELGLARWRFAQTKRFFVDVRETTAAAICAWAAESRSVPLVEIRPFIEQLRSVSENHESCELPLPDAQGQTFIAVLRIAIALLSAHHSHLLEPLSAKLRSLEMQPPQRLEDITLGAPQRETRAYREDPVHFRELRAIDARESLLKIACALAPHFTEHIDINDLYRVSELRELSEGWWANPYSVLRIARQSLERMAPGTTARMREAHAFHEPYSDWRILWAKFPELGPVDLLPPPPAPPSPAVQVLGNTRPIDDVLQDARLGPHGSLGKQLLSFVELHPLLYTFATRERLPVTDSLDPANHNSLSVRTAPKEKRGRQIEADRTVHGMMGEFFVYEYLQKQLPGFTADNWVSENRGKYGLEDTGQDSLGYDFRYFDEEGKLSGMSKALCLIEVKSSASQNPTAFFMSLNQWETAQECHNKMDCRYVIILVGSVNESPRIIDMIIDPVAHEKAGKLRRVADEFRVHLGMLNPNMPL
jgi:hypothetical protein